MEWREQSSVGCDEAFSEAQRWIEAVTKKTFGSNDFRSALENGVLLCDLINKIRPGVVKRVNRLPTPIAGLDNLNVFLRACGKLGLKEAQLFHPGDLQDLSTRVTVKHQETNRRLKNVLITIFWLGRRAQCDRVYDGPHLNFKAFEGLLGTALYKALQESSSQKGSNVRDSGFGDSWYSEREELYQLREGGGGGSGGSGHRRDDSLDSLDSLGSRPHSISSDTTLKGSSEGCCSDTEADSVFRMAENKDGLSYRRSVVITPKTTTQFNQFLPSKDKTSGYVPAPLRKKRAERHEDNRRSWASPIYTEHDGTLTRSKSTSDIQVDSTVARQVRYEELQKHREQIKDTEDKWQDDLSKWKNRRRSVNSDIVKKKEERDQIEQVTIGGNRRSKTFKEMQEERDNKGKKSLGSRLGSLAYLDDEEDVFERPVTSPRTRTLPARSFTIDTPYNYFEPSEPSLKEDDPPAASPATGRAASPPTSRRVDVVDRPAGRDATTTITPNLPPSSRGSLLNSAAGAPLQRSAISERSRPTKTEEKTTTVVSERSRPTKTEEKTTTVVSERSRPTKTEEKTTTVVSERSRTTKTQEKTTTVVSSSSALQKVAEPRRPFLRAQTEVEAPSPGFLYKQQPQPSSMEPKPPGVSHVSASLPRSYQKSDSARLTSVVTARPFGTQASRITSLPRVFAMGDPNKRVNGDASKKSSVPSRYHQFMTPEDEAHSSSAHSSEDEEEEEEEEAVVTWGKTAPKSVTLTQSTSPVPAPPVRREAPVTPAPVSPAPVSPAPAKESSQENYCDMRINLNQKPNSSRDFGFQAAWDSTGARVTTIAPGSPAEMCQLQAGDEVLSVNSQQVAEMSYTDWKSCMEEALQDGSLVMDVRRHGKNNWDRDQPSLPFKSHKTINLTSMDPILLGSPDSNTANSSLDFTSRMTSETLLPKELTANPVVDLASNGVNGSFYQKSVTMRNKESEPISLKNLKRRSEFFEQGGSESAMPDMPVPSITPSSSRWSWDPEDERRRQEKWQKEQERLLQEKYKRDQEKLQEEWLKSQEEIDNPVDQPDFAKPGSLEGNSHSVSPHSPLFPVNQPTSSQREEEERKRKEEQEQERRRQEEEKRKREEEEQELRRLREERERKERQAEEERKRREEERKRREEEERQAEEEKKRRDEEERERRRSEEEERKSREEELRRREEQREEERRWQEASEQQRRERERAFQQQQLQQQQQQQQQLQQQQQQWAAGSDGFNMHPPLSFTDRVKSQSSPQLDEEEKPQRRGVNVQPGGMAHWLLEKQLRSERDKQARSQRAASELEMERRNILNAMRYREPERVTGGSGLDERKGQQPLSHAELERQQILNEMKKKAPLLTDSSWIRQRSAAMAANKESDLPPMRRGDSLDNLDSYNSWRSSWTPRSNSYVQNYARPHSALSGSSSFYGGGQGLQRPTSSTLPSSYSMGSLRGGAGTPSSPWSQQTPSPSSLSPTTSPEPTSEAGALQQQSRSVSGKKICTFCDSPLGKGAAMIIESLGLCYHLTCFKCIDCTANLGGSEAGAEVRIRNKQLYCNSCYMRFKTGLPTAM
ncbi:LIM domain only protein 7 isoform X6 [Hippoglossus stenolepis]|uniref:LIM domain only protein 7 isoform X6 n=1 Tax=Hippoglossus stenolepis TaxID=195615 RepID=UPI001FB01DB9|nr:LIM domain only protein 7 isoform X6 [Hippoglossus stenolepis]